VTLSDTVIPYLQPEEHLILNCLRNEFSGGSHALVPSACPPHIRWDAVFEAALTWNIAPMVYPVVKNRPDILGSQAIPNAVLKAMEAAYIKTYMVNHANFLELTELIKVLTAADIQVILLKGAHLAPFVYQDLGMRWMADIDILIRRDDFQKTDRVLLEAGYAYPDLGTTVWEDSGEERELPDSAAVIEWYKTEHMHLIYSNPNAIQNLELHWGISRRASPFAIDTEGLWERAGAEKLNGQKVWVLSPTDLLLHISLHDAYYHHLELFGLRPCCDVAAVVRRFSGEIDWDLLQVRAREWGIEKYLYLMLRISHELLGVNISLGHLQPIGGNMCSERILRRSLKRILGKESEEKVYTGMKYPSQIQTFHPDERLSKKVRFFLKRIPISREELAFRYSLPGSSRLIWLCRFLRLTALLFSYSQVYLPYFWHRLRYGKNRAAAYQTLDLWLTSPDS
jgi:hypothetical protein